MVLGRAIVGLEQEKVYTDLNSFQMISAVWMLWSLGMFWNDCSKCSLFPVSTGLSGSPAAEPCRAPMGLPQDQSRETGGHE